MANSIDTAIAIYAVAATGAQLVPLNPAYTARELEPILADAEPALMVCDSGLEAMVRELAARTGIGQCIAIGANRRLTAWRGDSRGIESFPDPASLGLLQYTGGTTGRAKGVNLTHGAVATNVAQREALLPSEDGERILAVTPLYHSYAMAMGLHLACYCRGTLILLPRYHPKDVLDLIARERVTLFAGSPTLFVGLMSHADFANTDFSSLKLCFSGASALPTETLQRWEQATGCPICEGYGQTEAGPVLTYNPRHGRRKTGSVGLPLPRTEVQIVDADTGRNILPVGEAGEVRARGPQIMSGYRNRPEETATALRDGWLYTGDIGAFDEDGYLFIRDRKKDMVIVGGVQRLSARDRRGAVPASRYRRGRRGRRHRHLSRRNAARLCDAATDSDRQFRGPVQLSQGTADQIQNSGADRHPRRHSQNQRRQDRQGGAARRR